MYLDQSITNENADWSLLSVNLAGENVVVSMTKLSFCYVQALQVFPVSCLKSVSQCDKVVSSQKRATPVLDTDDPYHVACLSLHTFNTHFITSQWPASLSYFIIVNTPFVIS